MIHFYPNFDLKSMYPSCKNGINCSDDIVGQITFQNGQFSYSNGFELCMMTKSKKSANNPNTQKRTIINYTAFHKTNDIILLILESPSNSEFLNNVNRPANGNTGFRINSQLIPLLNKFRNVCFPVWPNNNSIFDIAIVNSIRYQCDLGCHGNRAIINSIFTSLWNKNGDPFSDDLIERINCIGPTLIINACSSNRSGAKLCTSSFLRNHLNYPIVESTNHPSVWSKNTILF